MFNLLVENVKIISSIYNDLPLCISIIALIISLLCISLQIINHYHKYHRRKSEIISKNIELFNFNIYSPLIWLSDNLNTNIKKRYPKLHHVTNIQRCKYILKHATIKEQNEALFNIVRLDSWCFKIILEKVGFKPFLHNSLFVKHFLDITLKYQLIIKYLTQINAGFTKHLLYLERILHESGHK